MIQLNSSTNEFVESDENAIQEALQHDLENNFETMDENDDDQNENHAHLLDKIPSNDEDDEQSLNEPFEQMEMGLKEETTLV